MRPSSLGLACAASFVLILFMAEAFSALHAQTSGGQSLPTADQRAVNPSGWQIPENARDEKSPVSPTPVVLKKGRGLFETHCQKCHGRQGKGDGPDADLEHKPADLTDLSRASRNSDGVMFYKIWNGRKDPKMPAFKSEMTKDDVWAVVEYAKSLRKGE